MTTATMRASGIALILLCGTPVAAAQFDAQQAARVAEQLEATQDPVARETLLEALAAATPDALVAFDRWYDLARNAEQPQRRARALRQAAVLALLTGQQAKLERLMARADGDEVVAWILRLAEGRASAPAGAAALLPRFVDDADSVRRLAAWWGPQRACDAAGDPLLCGPALPR